MQNSKISKRDGGAVLYVRLNTIQVVADTLDQVNSLRDLFPQRSIYTLTSPKAEAYNNVLDDSRFDKALVYPAPTDSQNRASLSNLCRFLAKQQISTTVVSYGSLKSGDHTKTLIASMFFPGKRFLLKSDLTLTPFTSPAAWMVFLTSFAATFNESIKQMLLSLYWKGVQFVRRKTKYRPLTNAQLESVTSILWIRLDHIGDIVMSLPALASLHNRYPNARIDVLTQSTNKSIARLVDGVTNIIEYDAPGHQKHGDRPSGVFTLARVLWKLISTKYDMAIDTRGDPYARTFALLSGATTRIGVVPCPYHVDEVSLWGLTLTNAVELKEFRHCAENGLNILSSVGLSGGVPSKTLTINEDLKVLGEAWLTEQGIDKPYAVLHMISREIHKNWSPEGMAAVADYLVTRHGMGIIVTGRTTDFDGNEQILSIASHPEAITNAAGTLPLTLLPAILADARIMITVDTGPMHIAAALGTPIISLFHYRTFTMHFPFGQKDRAIVAEEPDNLPVGDYLDESDFEHPGLPGTKYMPLRYIKPSQVCELVDHVLDETRTSTP